MKVLWLCNMLMPDMAKWLGIKPTNKEGWLLGLSNIVKAKKEIDLAIACPVSNTQESIDEDISGVHYFGFYENTVNPEVYDKNIEVQLKKIVDTYNPDVVHIFGTEYPHTLAMCKVLTDSSEKILIGIQGVMDIYKDHYFDGLPEYVINRSTIRDIIRRDSLIIQKDKYVRRAVNEVQAVRLAGNVTGRTKFDRDFSLSVNKNARYHFMNETLRADFYDGKWKKDLCIPHSIYVSQGNYPIKGLHYVLEALPTLLKKYPDIKVYVAGDNVTKHSTFKERFKLGSYGKYLLELINKNNLEDAVVFLGSLTSSEVKQKLLESNLFLCPSSIENSPNSLGEAMLLGVPCVAGNVGGISSIFEADKDGILYQYDDVNAMIESVSAIFDDKEKTNMYSENAINHARLTHDADANYQRLIEIYGDICNQ